jgi:tRNA (guanine6-N2)-methyltransferase
VPFFAISTRGLEDVSAAEVGSLDRVSLTASGYRRIDGKCGGSLAPLLSLRTLDDVYLYMETWGGIVRQRGTLVRLTSLAGELRLDYTSRILSGIRRIPDRPRFSVTASFVGKRNYTTEETKLAVADGVARNVPGWTYVTDDRQADLNLRLFMEHETVWVGARLARDALNRRHYKLASVPGSLKASVAASLVRISGAGLDRAPQNSVLLDPFCGAGTILAEAGLMGFAVLGGDAQSNAFRVARENLGHAGVNAWVRQWDAAQLPLPDNSVERVVTNLPWGRQVTVDSGHEDLYSGAFHEILRVLTPRGRIVVLTTLPDLLAPFRSCLVEQREISLFGQRPQVLVFEP